MRRIFRVIRIKRPRVWGNVSDGFKADPLGRDTFRIRRVMAEADAEMGRIKPLRSVGLQNPDNDRF